MAETNKPVPSPEADRARLNKVPHTAGTGGDAKQATVTQSGPVDVPEGKLASDAEKEALHEANADADVGDGDGSDALGSGAIIEPGVRNHIDFEHPAVDNRPRFGLPEHSNRIDFNDPNY